MKLLRTLLFISLLLLPLLTGCAKKDTGIFTSDELEKKAITLESPPVSAVEKAYYKLSPRGTLFVKTDELHVTGILTRLERLGFIGLTLEGKGRSMTVTAYKGKAGPCYETGRTASLKNKALLAALDDDNNLIFGKVPVCEKTAQIYSATLYKEQVEVSPPSTELYSALVNGAPALFDHGSPEKAAAEASSAVSGAKEAAETAVIYGGPFKVLIMKNGTMIRRGQAVQVAKETASLLEKENCRAVKLSSAKKRSSKFLPMNYSEKYGVAGKYFLLSDFPITDPNLK